VTADVQLYLQNIHILQFNKCVYYVYSKNTTIVVRSGTVCINNYMFRPLYWPLSGSYSTLVSNHTVFAVHIGRRDLVYNILVVNSIFIA
jgi:hypothetical protein